MILLTRVIKWEVKKKRGVDGKSTFRILTEHWMQRVVFFFSDHTAIFVQLVSPTKYTTQVGRWFWILELKRRHSSVRVVNASVGLETWALYQKNSDFDFSFLQPACCVISFGCRKKTSKQTCYSFFHFSSFFLWTNLFSSATIYTNTSGTLLT